MGGEIKSVKLKRFRKNEFLDRGGGGGGKKKKDFEKEIYQLKK